MLKNKTVRAFGASLALCNAVAFAGPLADSPLSLKGAVPPNVLFTLSVEWPTADVYAHKDPDIYGYSGPDGSAAGSSTPADNYNSANQYPGYWDFNKCYTYDSTNGWFAPASISESGVCNGSQWSGNFLNWVSTTGLDAFRFAMTGGNRVQDTPTLTVIQASYHDGQGGQGQYPTKKISGAPLVRDSPCSASCRNDRTDWGPVGNEGDDR